MRWLWRHRRWAYAAYVLFSVTRIPAEAGFRVSNPHCDLRVTLETAQLSLMKVPHVLLFAWFFLLTVAQFDRLDRRVLAVSMIGTLVMGALVEIEEGATRMGICRATDLLPDAAGALLAMTLLFGAVMSTRFVTGARTRMH
jgi:hypothetical protein